MVFTTSHDTPLYSAALTPTSSAGYAGLCVLLAALALILRSLLALRAVLEQRWLAAARDRRYVVVRRRRPGTGDSGDSEAAAQSVDADPDAKAACLISARGIEERVRVVRAHARGPLPFRLSVDVPRAGAVLVVVGLSYLL